MTKYDREKALNLSKEELEKMGFRDESFLAWYVRFVIRLLVGLAALVGFLLLLNYGMSVLTGSSFAPTEHRDKVYRLILVCFTAPLIVIGVSYVWWYGSILLEKIFPNRKP